MTKKDALFEQGEVVMSPNTRLRLKQYQFPAAAALLEMHQSGDYGVVSDAREIANDMSIAAGRGRVVSRWPVDGQNHIVQIVTVIGPARETRVTLLKKR